MNQSNDWTLQRETVLTPLPLPEQEQEQSIELDYVLPDYYPDFFRLLSCTADTEITVEPSADGQAAYTLLVQLHVLYCGEQSSTVQAVHQQLDYRGRIQLPAGAADAAGLQIRLSAEPSYLNCRAVSQRRIDLRGAIRIRAAFSAEQQQEVLSSAEGLHVRTRAEPVSCITQLLRSEKRFTLSDDIRLSEVQPALLSVLRTHAAVSVSESRTVAGKLVIKGEAAVDLIYTAEHSIETLSAVLPFSQIAEQNGLSDDMTCTVTAQALSFHMTPEAEGSGDVRLLHADLDILLSCESVRQNSTSLLTDLYSTVHPAEPQTEDIVLLTAPQPVSERLQQRVTVSQPDAVLTKVCAAWAEPENLRTAADPAGGTVITGTLHCFVLAEDAESHPLMLEQREAFTWELPALQTGTALPPVTVQSCPYTLSGSDSVTLQPELLLSGRILQQTPHRLLTDVLIDPEIRLPVTEHYALRLYFGQPEESLWEIAKRYHTTEEAIRAENDVSADCLTEPKMLLIPIVS